MTRKFGIQASALTGVIHVGRLNKAQTLFLDGKEDATDLCIGAVADYCKRNFNGHMLVQYPNLDVAIEVRVMSIEEAAGIAVKGEES